MLSRRSSHPIRVVVIAALAGAIGAACTEEPAVDASGPPNLDVYAVAVCNHLVRCQPAFVWSQFGAVDACIAAMREEARARLARPGVKVTRRVLNACAVAVSDATCDVVVEALAPCVMEGSLADGARCASGVQCASGGCKRDGACGVCAPVARAGDSCDRAACAADLDCVDGTCRARGGAGASCDARARCAPGLVCGDLGVCFAPASRNEPCADRPCSADQGLHCVDGRCKAIVAEVVESCAAATCVRSRCLGSVCAALGGRGDACAGAGECAFPLVCVDGRCGEAEACD